MTVGEMLHIFAIEKILVENDHNEVISEQHENGEPYYMIRLSEKNYILVFHQRGIESVELIFETKEQAFRYFCIFQMERKFNREYINSAVRSNGILYSDHMEYENLIELFQIYSIPNKYESLNSTPLPETVHIKMINDDEFIVEVLNQSRVCIHKTIELDKQTAFFVCFRWTYLYYLIHTHVNLLQKQGLFLEQLSDKDIITLLSSI